METCILIGGRSNRMGVEKPLINVGELTIIENVMGKVSGLSDRIYLIANRNNISRYVRFVSDTISIIQDRIDDIGPLGGIHAGLENIEGDEAFFLAGDIPFLNSQLLRSLEAKYYEDSSADAAVCKTSDGVQPLVAIYSKKIMPVIMNHIEECMLDIRDFLKNINVKYYECEFRDKVFHDLEQVDLEPND